MGDALHPGAGDPVAVQLTAHVVRYDRRVRSDGGGRAPCLAERQVEELETLIDGADSVVLVLSARPDGVPR